MTADLLREIARAGPEHLDAAYVAGYDRKAGFDPADDLYALRSRGLGAESTLVDFGAGTGTLAVAAAAMCKRVIAVDVSPAMVDAVRRKAEDARVANVVSVHAGFLSYQHDGEAPDFIYTRNALHHLPDFWKAVALRRIAELLAPGGTFQLRDLVFSFDLSDPEAGIEHWLRSSASDCTEDGWTRAELETHLRREYSTFTWLLEPMIARAGLTIEVADYGSVGAYANYVCAKPSEA
jgi:SAM-dependent methyltransferase